MEVTRVMPVQLSNRRGSLDEIRGMSAYKPRSIVFDLFGDFVRPRTDGIPLRAITELLGLFGAIPSTVRVVMARLHRDGWLDSRRSGRETTYFLNEQSRRLLDEGRAQILDRTSEAWDGNWYLVIYTVPEAKRQHRGDMRKELAWLGYGTLAASTWISPHDHSDSLRTQFAHAEEATFDFLRCQTESLIADRELTSRCWDLDTLNGRYEEWIRRYQRFVAQDSAELSGAEALMIRLEATHDYRRLLFKDPRLPAELLIPEWKGEVAYQMLKTIRDRHDAEANAYFDRIADG
jgi:phenylacetic acid degradation operon negative regulatory protein